MGKAMLRLEYHGFGLVPKLLSATRNTAVSTITLGRQRHFPDWRLRVRIGRIGIHEWLGGE